MNDHLGNESCSITRGFLLPVLFSLILWLYVQLFVFSETWTTFHCLDCFLQLCVVTNIWQPTLCRENGVVLNSMSPWDTWVSIKASRHINLLWSLEQKDACSLKESFCSLLCLPRNFYPLLSVLPHRLILYCVCLYSDSSEAQKDASIMIELDEI